MALSGSALCGTLVSLGFGSSVYDMEVTDATIVCDPPAVNGVVSRATYKWRPASPELTDPRLTWDDVNERIVFTLTSTDTAAMVPGHWDLYMLVGDPATSQDDIAHYDLYLYTARGGAMPVV